MKIVSVDRRSELTRPGGRGIDISPLLLSSMGSPNKTFYLPKTYVSYTNSVTFPIDTQGQKRRLNSRVPLFGVECVMLKEVKRT